jgi:hypothetical protein
MVGKRIAIISLVILVSGLALLGYFLQQSRKNLFTDPYKAITPDACIVVETIDLQSLVNSLTAGKGLFAEVEKVKEFDSFNRKLKYLADQLNKPGYKKFLHEGIAIIAFHPSEKGKLLPLLSMTVPAEMSFRQLKEAIQMSGIKEIDEQRINGKKTLILPFNLNNRKDTVFISIISGLMVSSTSRELVKKAQLQINIGTDIRSIRGFSRILLTSGKNEDKIFVVFNNLSKVVRSFLGAGALGMEGKITKLAGSAGGDIYFNDGGLTLSGYTESSDSSEFLYRYKFIQPVSFHTYKVLPSSTALFESLVMTEESLGRKPDPAVSDEIYNLAVKLIPYIGEEITRAYMDIKNRPVSENSLVIYELKNRVQCEQIFLASFNKQTSINYFQPDDQTKIPVYLTNNKGLISILIPGFAPGFNDSYFAFYDNFMITGNSYITISRLLYDNMLNKTLANDLRYREFEGMLPSRAGYIFYCIPSHIIDFLAGYFNEDIITGLRSNKNSLNKIQSAGYQFASINGMIYNSLSIRYQDEVREESTTEWETLLDTTAGIKPFFFTNHITGAKEIFIQDIKNNAYLINAAGRVLWKVPLKERIIGSVYMTDYFKNGKYQLLFSGKNNIHLLDRNGNYVERYPIRLRSPATNSLALFDYDNNRTYRLIIAGEDKLVYAYDKTGSVVKGWKPFRTAGYVSAEASFFRVSGKDYIIVADEASVYFLDRSGNVRLNLKEAVTKSKGSSLRLTPGSEPALVCTSPDGTIQNIFFDGSVKKFSLRKFSVDHSFDFFDVDSDGFGEYIFIDKGVLYLYDHNRGEMFTRKFSSDELGGPIDFIFSASDRKIGVFDINKKQIYLVDKKGEIMNGFPLRGASMFSIGKLSDKNDWNLIVGGTDKFLYNYKLDTEIK